VAPATASIKKTPDITDIIGEKGEREKGEEGEGAKGRKGEEENDEMIRRLDDEMINNNGEQSSNHHIPTSSNHLIPTSSNHHIPTSSNHHIPTSSNHHIPTSSNHLIPTSSNHLTTPVAPAFSDSWRAMFEQVFAAVPTIYIPLKELLPEVENNVIKVVVKNEIQKEHFEAKTRDVLAFFRTHYDEKIEDIVVETNENLETKKIIYDDKDKLQNFKEQNEEFEDFVQILELTIKG
jgi:hypothetical protein